jgi:hypothetical protein
MELAGLEPATSWVRSLNVGMAGASRGEERQCFGDVLFGSSGRLPFSQKRMYPLGTRGQCASPLIG